MKFIRKEDKIFAYENDVELGFIWWTTKDDIISVVQTLVHENARGKGVAKFLNEVFFKDLNEKSSKETKIKIWCSYSLKYFENNKKLFPNLTLVKED